MFAELRPYVPYLIMAFGAAGLYFLFSGPSNAAEGPSLWSRLGSAWADRKAAANASGATDQEADELDLAALSRLRERGRRHESKKISAAVAALEVVYFDDQRKHDSEAAA